MKHAPLWSSVGLWLVIACGGQPEAGDGAPPFSGAAPEPPSAEQPAVVPVEDDIKGQKPVAFVIRKPGHALDVEAVKRFALAHAPAYQHPRFVWFVDELPLASTNKLDRATLRRLAERRLAEERLAPQS